MRRPLPSPRLRFALRASVLAMLALLLLAAPALAQTAVDYLQRAQVATGKGDYKEALVQVDAGLKADPAYFPLYKQKAVILALRQEHELALEAAAFYLEKHPDDADLRMLELSSLLELKRVDQFKEKLGSLPLKNLPDDTVLNLVVRMHGAPAYAETLTRLLDEAAPKGEKTGALLEALRQLRAGEPARTMAALRAFKPNPGAERELAGKLAFETGLAFAQRQQLEEARVAFDFAKTFGVAEVNIRRELGWVLRKQGDAAGAAEQWLAAVKQSTDPAQWYGWILDALMEAGQWDKAEAAMAEALQRTPDNAQLQAKRMVVLDALGRQNDLVSLQFELENAGATEALALGRALLQKRAGRATAAAGILRDAKLDDKYRQEYVDLLRQSAATLQAQGRHADAEAALLEMLEISPGNVPLMRDIGWALWAQDKRAEALDMWTMAIDYGLDNPKALAEQVTFLLVEKDNIDLALEFQRVHLGGDVFSLAMRAKAAKRYDLAQKLFQRALTQNLHPLHARLLLAEAALENGDNDAARAVLEVFVKEPLATAAAAAGDKPPLAERDTAALAVRVLSLMAVKKQTDLLFFYDHALARFAAAPQLAAALPEIQARLGVALFDNGENARALKFLEQTIQRDPGNAQAWCYKAMAHLRLNQPATADDAVARARSLAPPPALLERVLGEQAIALAEPEVAATHLRRSLDLDPKQTVVRQQLVRVLASLRRTDEARELASWFERAFQAGDAAIAGELADAREALGDREGALALWRQLAEASPRVPAYRLNLARLLFENCQQEEALHIAQGVFQERKDERASILMAEIAMAMGRYRQVIEAADQGLARNPDNLQLLRTKAEAAEYLKDFPMAERAARVYLGLDGDYEPMQTLMGRALMEQKKYRDAQRHYAAMLAKNPAYQRALLETRAIAQAQGDRKTALDLAENFAEIYPDSSLGRILKATSAGERRHFWTAYRTISQLERLPPNTSIPVLYLENISDCDYPTSLRFEKVKRHIAALHEAHYTLISPDLLVPDPETGGFMRQGEYLEDDKDLILVVANSPAGVIQKIDQLLREIGGHAVLVVGEKTLAATAPDVPDRAGLLALEASGRWTIALTDDAAPEIPVDAAGAKGSFWHRRMVTDHLESREEMTARLQARMQTIQQAAGFLAKPPALWYYPQGSYGQMSLQADGDVMAANEAAAMSRFQGALAQDPLGFLVPSTIPSRIPCAAVLPSWSEEKLVAHLTESDPHRDALLHSANIHSWHGQFEAASKRYQKAEQLGVNSRDLYLGWGANAFYQGDIPTALDLLRRAQALDPDSRVIANALEMARNATLPTGQYKGDFWGDSDRRTYSANTAEVTYTHNERLRLKAKVGHYNWFVGTKGTSSGATGGDVLAGNPASGDIPRRSLDATEAGGGLRYYIQPEYWVDAEGSAQFVKHKAPRFLGSIALRGPIHAEEFLNWNGHYVLSLARESIDTVEAVQAGIMLDRLSLAVNSRLYDFIDLSGQGSLIWRTDGNDGWSIAGSAMYRFWEEPLLSAGYAFEVGNSETDPDEYYAPRELRAHFLQARARYNIFEWLSVGASTGYGWARELGTDWEPVWRAEANLNMRLRDNLFFELNGARLKLPDYELARGYGGFSFRF